jgi:hypothetical protein
VEETRFRGVYLVYAPPGGLARLVLRDYLAFVKRIVISEKCIIIPPNAGSSPQLWEILQLESVRNGCVEAHLRGLSRRLLGGIMERDSSKGCEETLVVEGVDEIVLWALARELPCGDDCRILVDRAVLRGVPI